MSDKATGSYYTPFKLVEYMTEFIRNRFNINDVLEPAAGDGRFIDTLSSLDCTIHGIEIDNEKTEYLKKKNYNNLKITCADFIDYAMEHEET